MSTYLKAFRGLAAALEFVGGLLASIRSRRPVRKMPSRPANIPPTDGTDGLTSESVVSLVESGSAPRDCAAQPPEGSCESGYPAPAVSRADLSREVSWPLTVASSGQYVKDPAR